MATGLFLAADATPATRLAAYAMMEACRRCRRVVDCRILLGASPAEAGRAIVELSPRLLGLEGHGGPDRIALQARRVFLTADSPELRLLAGKLVFALSCSTADELGRAAVEKGARAYIGWREEYLFATLGSGDPLYDKYGRLFFKPVVEALTLLCAGRSAEAATEHIRLSYASSAEQLLMTTDPAAPLVAAMLQHDAETLELLGDPGATCCPRAGLEIVAETRAPRIAEIVAAILAIIAIS